MTDKILKIAKRLKTFTLEDIVMFTGLEIDTVRNFLDQSDNIQKFKNEFEYVGIIQKEETFKIIDKNILSQNSDITLIDAINLFMEIKNCKLSSWSKKTYKSFINSQILPYFKKYKLKDITIQDIEQFKLSMNENGITERRIKNILTLLNQIIKHFQKEGFIDIRKIGAAAEGFRLRKICLSHFKSALKCKGNTFLGQISEYPRRKTRAEVPGLYR